MQKNYNLLLTDTIERKETQKCLSDVVSEWKQK